MNRKLIISITSETDAMQDFKAGFLQAFNTGSYQDEYIYFTSPTVLFQKITPKRWELITTLQEVGTVSIRELARLLGRDIRNPPPHGKQTVGIAFAPPTLQLHD
jgi:predicted transcriptional regulator